MILKEAKAWIVYVTSQVLIMSGETIIPLQALGFSLLYCAASNY